MTTIWFFIIFLILVIGYGIMSFRMSDLKDKYNRSDIEKLESKGFDKKTSFRHPIK